MTSRQLVDAFALAPPALQLALRAAGARDPRRDLVQTLVEEAQVRRLELAERRRAVQKGPAPRVAC